MDTTTSTKNKQRAEKRAEKRDAKAEEKAATEAVSVALKEAKSAKLSDKVDTLLEKVQEFFPEAKSSQDYTTGQTNGVRIFISGKTIFSVTFFYLENKLNVVFTFDTEADADEISSFLTKLKHKALFMTKKDLETGVIFAATVKEVLKFFRTIDNCIAVIYELIAPPRTIAAPVTVKTFAPTKEEPSPAEVSGKATALTATSSSVAVHAPIWKPVVAPTPAPVAVTPAQSAKQTSSTEEDLEELAKQLCDVRAKYEAKKRLLIEEKRKQLQLAQAAAQACQEKLDELTAD